MPILLVLIFSWLALLLYYPYFHIRSITVHMGNESPNAHVYQDWMRAHLEKKHLFDLSSSFFFFQESRVEQALYAEFPLESAVVSKEFPQQVVLTLTEKRNDILLIERAVALRAYTNGSTEPVPQLSIVVPTQEEGSVESATATSTPIIAPSSLYKALAMRVRSQLGDIPIVFTRGKHIEDSTLGTFAQKILDFTTLMKTAGILTGGEEAWYLLLDTENPYAWTIGSPIGWHIYVDTRRDLSSQLLHSKKVLEHNDPTQVEYIDARFYDTVYVKKK